MLLAAAVGLDRMTVHDFEKLKAELGLVERNRRLSQADELSAVYKMI